MHSLPPERTKKYFSLLRPYPVEPTEDDTEESKYPTWLSAPEMKDLFAASVNRVSFQSPNKTRKKILQLDDTRSTYTMHIKAGVPVNKRKI